MAENSSDVENILREWAPVSDFLNNIPTKSQNGIFNQDVCLTCVDILPEYIAVGTNLGLVYWYDRKNKNLQRLRCENSNSKVTAIKIISTVDYMLACGNCEGQISIFQIPKTHPDTLPDILKPKNKQVERYTVSDLHTSQITCLEWAKNGMKLFSGDKNGLIVFTEIDFYMHLSKSVDILNEAFEVIQLNYCQQYLLISTTYRTIVCKKEEKWKVLQVGKKDRKTLGKLGAIFWKNSLKPNDLLIYCTRPGLRIWISDLNGTVLRTLLFKDLLNKECYEVPLLNPITGYAKKLRPNKDATFGILVPFADNLLVTYSSEIIYILDPVNLLVIATISHLRRIISVAVNRDEIFVLEGERSLIRISFRPEPHKNGDTHTSYAGTSTFLPLAIKDLTSKIQTSNIMSALPAIFDKQHYDISNKTTSSVQPDVSVQTDATSIINAEEAQELPPVRKLASNLKLTLTNTSVHTSDSNGDVFVGLECSDERNNSVRRKLDVFDKISEENYDDNILFKHRRRKKSNILSENIPRTENLIVESTISDNNDCNIMEKNQNFQKINQACLLNLSVIGNIQNLESKIENLDTKTENTNSKSVETILNEIQNKEILLADILNLDKIKFSTFQNDLAIEKSQNGDEFYKKINFRSNTTDILAKSSSNYDLLDQNMKNTKEVDQKNAIKSQRNMIDDRETNKNNFCSNTVEYPKSKCEIFDLNDKKINNFSQKNMIDHRNKDESDGIYKKNNFCSNTNMKQEFLEHNLKTNCDVTQENYFGSSGNDPIANKNSISLNYGPPSGSSNPNSMETPACLAVPNIWKLQEITISTNENEVSDNSLCDWEII